MLRLDREVDHLSSDDHYQDQVLKNIHEEVLAPCVVDGETYLCQVFVLFHVIVLIGDIPTHGVS